MEDSTSMANPPLEEFYIPSYIMSPELEAESIDYIPTCPVIVFINSKSGGQLGSDLLITYRGLLNKAQVLESMHKGEYCMSIIEVELGHKFYA